MKGHAGPERAGEIDVEHLYEGLDLEFLVARENTGAVDQRVDALVFPGEGRDGLVIGDIERRERETRARFEEGAGKIGLVRTRCCHCRTQIAELIADGGANVTGAADHDGMKAGGERKIRIHRECLTSGISEAQPSTRGRPARSRSRDA
ncbi:hypothetical protein ABIB94_006565 [Bradyrhizobium sp. JR7.2]